MAQAQKKEAEQPAKELVVIEDLNAKEVFTTEKGVESLIAKVKAQTVPKLDPSTEEGMEERRTLAAQIARTKTAVFNMGKDYVAELKQVTKAIDKQKRTWWDVIEEHQHEVRKPLTDYEQAEEARKSQHLQAVQWMRESVNFDYITDSAGIEERLAKLKEVGARDFEEFADQANTVLENSTGRLGEMLAESIKQEQEAAELERLRAEKAERDEQDRIAKIKEQAKEEARAELEAEQQASFEEVNETPPAEPTPEPADAPKTTTPAAPAADTEKEHRRTVNQAVVNALVDECMLSESAAKAVTTAIIKGEIPNVNISYERQQ